MNTTTTPALAQLARYERTPINSEIARRIQFAESTLVSALEAIASRVAGLLDDLQNERPYEAITTIVQTAGASGPIGSQWEKAIAKAVELESLMLYATEEVTK